MNELHTQIGLTLALDEMARPQRPRNPRRKLRLRRR